MIQSLTTGYAQAVITPALDHPVFLAGFGRNRRATAIHDDLYARALALDWGCNPIVLVALDLIGFGRADCQKIAARFPSADLVICCTHTHHGPDTLGLWGPDLETSGVDQQYMRRLEEIISATVQLALQNCQTSQVKSAAVEVPGVARNARDPYILDQELSILQFCHPQTSQPQSTLVVFPCHPETLFDTNTVITSDYPHSLRQAVEQATGGPCIFFSGSLGGMMTPDVSEHSFQEAAQNGARLASAGLLALVSSPAETPSRLSYSRIEYKVPLQSPLLEAAIQAGLVRDTRIEDQNIYTEAGLLRLGQAWLAFAPGEVLPALGLRLKSTLAQAGAQVPVVIGLANDELGYILPDGAFRFPENLFEPGDHYEETMSIGPHAGSCLQSAIETLINSSQPDQETL